MAPKVLVSDKLSDTAVQIFRDRGIDVDFMPELGKDKVNIANMSMSRDQGEGFAISVFELDSVPSEKAQADILKHDAIMKFRVIEL